MNPVLSILISSVVGGIIGGVSYGVYKTLTAKNIERVLPNNELTRQLKEKAAETGRSYSELLDEAVEQYMKQDIIN